MTPARILAICRDEWPALRWPEPSHQLRPKGYDGDGIEAARVIAVSPDWVVAWVGDASSGYHPLTERGIRRALREARRLVTP